MPGFVPGIFVCPEACLNPSGSNSESPVMTSEAMAVFNPTDDVSAINVIMHCAASARLTVGMQPRGGA